MLNFLLLMLVPIAIAVGSILIFKGRVTLGEFALQLAVPAICLALGLGIAYWQSMADTEIWNGVITNKAREVVSCRHSYQCNCVTTCSGNGKSETCTTICQTCYEHSFDIDWKVYASTGEGLWIDTIDRQGLDMPPRWAAAYVGEPFSSQHTYQNYILANPDSVLLGGKGDIETFKTLLPAYPKVYDYYRVAHTINMGVPLTRPDAWEWLIDKVNGDLGPSKQINLTVLFVRTADPRYMLALKDWWVGGKKNDAVIVLASLDGHKIEWADVLSWTPNATYKVLLRDTLPKYTLDQRDAIVATIRKVTQSEFRRMEMKDYKYLVYSFQPSRGAMLFLLIFGVALSVGVAYFTITNDITDYISRYKRSW